MDGTAVERIGRLPARGAARGWGIWDRRSASQIMGLPGASCVISGWGSTHPHLDLDLDLDLTYAAATLAAREPDRRDELARRNGLDGHPRRS